MPTRKHISTGEVRDIDQTTLDGWAAANNPKLAVWEAYTPPEPPPVEPPYPPEVGSGQIRAALIAEGWVAYPDPQNPTRTPDEVLDAWAIGLINTYVADAGQRVIATLLWHNASGFKFGNVFIELIAGVMGKSLEQRKQLFRTADTF
jgi:hypothetical protein